MILTRFHNAAVIIVLGLSVNAILFASGCVIRSPRRQTFQYKDFVLFRAEPWEVDQACTRIKTRNDGGEPISSRVRCCWDPERFQMWVAWDDVDCIPHELCHKDRFGNEVCTKMNWNNGGGR